MNEPVRRLHRDTGSNQSDFIGVIMAKRIIKDELTAERLRELLDYNQHTGEFVWRVSCRGTKAGDIAGSSGNEGRRHITIGYARFKAHRLAWLYVHGVWPKGLIDHINGTPSDNRIDNLREATVSENQCNQKVAHSHNKTGLLGAHWREDKNKYRSRISIDGREVFLGYFDTAEDAHKAYVCAKNTLHPFSASSGRVEQPIVRPKRSDKSISGVTGVRLEKRAKTADKWSAKITRSGVTTHLGLFDTKELAAAAYENEKNKT